MAFSLRSVKMYKAFQQQDFLVLNTALRGCKRVDVGTSKVHWTHVACQGSGRQDSHHSSLTLGLWTVDTGQQLRGQTPETDCWVGNPAPPASQQATQRV